MIKFVILSSATEAEITALFMNTMTAIPIIRNVLINRLSKNKQKLKLIIVW